MAYCPFCIVRKEILYCNIEIVLQAVGENAEKLYCNIAFVLWLEQLGCWRTVLQYSLMYCRRRLERMERLYCNRLGWMANCIAIQLGATCVTGRTVVSRHGAGGRWAGRACVLGVQGARGRLACMGRAGVARSRRWGAQQTHVRARGARRHLGGRRPDGSQRRAGHAQQARGRRAAWALGTRPGR